MSVEYRAVLWNRQKRWYDAVLVSGVIFYLVLFAGVSAVLHPAVTIETILIRGFGSAALILLHIILAIGPLCRLDARFLPFLYNRRHMGVMMFLLAAAHGILSLVQFHSFGDVNPVVSLLTSNLRFDSLGDFPFQQLGLAALAILFLMAATSHDFWLHVLTPRIWKSLHMLVYVAYALLVAHVALGAMQSDRGYTLPVLLGLGVASLSILHVAAATKERGTDTDTHPADTGFVPVCEYAEIPENRAVVVTIGDERVAVFRYSGKVSAISNVCRHQNGPLGEGKIVDGCVTCPWHGYQYRPGDGCSPPPFTDKVQTYRTLIEGTRVLVHKDPLPEGTYVEPAVFNRASEVRA